MRYLTALRAPSIPSQLLQGATVMHGVDRTIHSTFTVDGERRRSHLRREMDRALLEHRVSVQARQT